MPTSTRELLALAKRLQQQKGDEATRRCAVSRAYYAALHETDCVFEKRDADFRLDGESSHAEIISRATIYGNGVNPGRDGARNIAQILSKLRRARNKADYKLEQGVDAAECSDVITRAEQVLAHCQEVLSKRQSQVERTPEAVRSRPSLKRVR